MNDSYFTQASNYAKQAADQYKSTFDSTLNDLLKMSNLQKEQATNNYNNLLNQINANRTNLQQNYETNARQAYVNKLLADQQTTDTLSRMNLNQSGFRLTQDTLNNNQYSANLNQLALAQDAGLRDLDTQGLNALNDYNNNLLKLDLDYNSKLAALKQQIADNVNDYYNKAYDRFYGDLKYQDQLKQQEWENQMKQRQFEESLKRQEIENRMNQQKINASTRNTTNTTNNTYWTNGSGGGNGANGVNGVNWQNGVNGQNGQNGQLKYTPPVSTSGKLSNKASMWLASFLLHNGSRDETGKYNAHNTSVSRDVLAQALNRNTSLTPAEKTYIKSLFGVTGDLGGSNTSSGVSGAGSSGTPQGVSANGDVTLQGTYSPKLSSNAANSWFNSLTNSISKNGFKMNYSDLIGQLQTAARNNTINETDAGNILKAFGITEKGITTPSGSSKSVSSPVKQYNKVNNSLGNAVTLNIGGSPKTVYKGKDSGYYYYDSRKGYTKVTRASQLNEINNQLQKKSSTKPNTSLYKPSKTKPNTSLYKPSNKYQSSNSSAVNKFTSILNSLKFGK